MVVAVLLLIALGLVVYGNSDDFLLHDDRPHTFDDLHNHYYSTGENFHYNDFYTHNYHHIGGYAYYYHYDAIATAEFVGTVHTKDAYVNSLAVSGSTILVGGYDGPVYVFEYENKRATFLYSWNLPPNPPGELNASLPKVALDDSRAVIQKYDRKFFFFSFLSLIL